MDDYKIISGFIIEFLKTILWPMITLIGLYIFKDSIISFLNRIREVNYGNNSIKADQQSKNNELNNEIKEEVKIVYQLETDKYAEDKIKSYIVNFDTLNDEEKINKLFYLSKYYFTTSRFEWIYGVIFGSQIRILEYLNTIENSKESNIKEFYDNSSSKYPEIYSTYNFSSYLNFLKSNYLIETINDELISITQTGQDFLVFLVQSKKDKQKVY